ncbi:hypothetical protein DPMN_174344 [Dreissena polymorpha]|uniref:Endonuclease/exonuclease/phosphatase domain-containing protein n=1 Tax=Dreissena polymorpha TaxID=45954 RepID=A0A9D4E4G5_DREPO|nr:hypothetical protein DPMN_174344 [Dreissena polymorpha]
MRRRDCQEKYCASPRLLRKILWVAATVKKDIPQHDMLMLLGDFNAKVCCDNKDKKRTMGRHGVDVITNNGERLVNSANRTTLS